MQTFERHLSDEERASLTIRLSSTPKPGEYAWLVRGLAGIIVAGIFLLTTVVILFEGRAGWMETVGAFLVGLACLMCFVGGCGAWLLVSAHRRFARYEARFIEETAPKIRAALEHGLASVRRVVAVGVIVIEEFEDEQSAFIYDLGDGTCFYLRGEAYYLDCEPEGRWPTREFEIVRAAVNDLWVGVFNCLGRWSLN